MAVYDEAGVVVGVLSKVMSRITRTRISIFVDDFVGF